MNTEKELIAIISSIQDKGVCDPVDFYDTGYTISNEEVAAHLVKNGAVVCSKETSGAETNFERITKTVEDLAAFIAQNQYRCAIPQSCAHRDCKECIKKWLKQEVDRNEQAKCADSKEKN